MKLLRHPLKKLRTGKSTTGVSSYHTLFPCPHEFRCNLGPRRSFENLRASSRSNSQKSSISASQCVFINFSIHHRTSFYRSRGHVERQSPGRYPEVELVAVRWNETISPDNVRIVESVNGREAIVVGYRVSYPSSFKSKHHAHFQARSLK